MPSTIHMMPPSDDDILGIRQWFWSNDTDLPGARPARISSGVSLADVTGTYRWVWEARNAEEWEYHNPTPYDIRSKFVLETEQPASDDLSSFKGLFYMGSWSMNFTGLKALSKETHAYELLKIVKDASTQSDLCDKNHYFEIMSEKDDDGHPFIKFHWYANPRTTGTPQRSWLLAKRWEEGTSTWKQVSAEEKSRLGWDMDEEEWNEREEEEEAAEKEEAAGEKAEGSSKENDGASGPEEAHGAISEMGQKRERSESVAKHDEDGASKKAKTEDTANRDD